MQRQDDGAAPVATKIERRAAAVHVGEALPRSRAGRSMLRPYEDFLASDYSTESFGDDLAPEITWATSSK
jgi:hypothetical protein